MLRDAGEHFGPDFNPVMERPNVVGKLGITVPQLDVGAALGNGIPPIRSSALKTFPAFALAHRLKPKRR